MEERGMYHTGSTGTSTELKKGKVRQAKAKLRQRRPAGVYYITFSLWEYQKSYLLKSTLRHKKSIYCIALQKKLIIKIDCNTNLYIM